MDDRPCEWMLENATQQDSTAEVPPKPSTVLGGTDRSQVIHPKNNSFRT
jgi:hypothetical protein